MNLRNSPFSGTNEQVTDFVDLLYAVQQWLQLPIMRSHFFKNCDNIDSTDCDILLSNALNFATTARKRLQEAQDFASPRKLASAFTANTKNNNPNLLPYDANASIRKFYTFIADLYGQLDADSLAYISQYYAQSIDKNDLIQKLLHNNAINFSTIAKFFDNKNYIKYFNTAILEQYKIDTATDTRTSNPINTTPTEAEKNMQANLAAVKDSAQIADANDIISVTNNLQFSAIDIEDDKNLVIQNNNAPVNTPVEPIDQENSLTIASTTQTIDSLSHSLNLTDYSANSVATPKFTGRQIPVENLDTFTNISPISTNSNSSINDYDLDLDDDSENQEELEKQKNIIAANQDNPVAKLNNNAYTVKHRRGSDALSIQLNIDVNNEEQVNKQATSIEQPVKSFKPVTNLLENPFSIFDDAEPAKATAESDQNALKLNIIGKILEDLDWWNQQVHGLFAGSKLAINGISKAVPANVSLMHEVYTCTLSNNKKINALQKLGQSQKKEIKNNCCFSRMFKMRDDNTQKIYNLFADIHKMTAEQLEQKALQIRQGVWAKPATNSHKNSK
jgi:hypothetical protein